MVKILSRRTIMQNKKFPQSTSNHAQSKPGPQSATKMQNSNNAADGKQPHQPTESAEKDNN